MPLQTVEEIDKSVYSCPGCKNTERLEISANVWVRLTANTAADLQTDDGGVVDSSHEWDGDSTMRCWQCGFTDVSSKFKVTDRARAKLFDCSEREADAIVAMLLDAGFEGSCRPTATAKRWLIIVAPDRANLDDYLPGILDEIGIEY